MTGNHWHRTGKQSSGLGGASAQSRRTAGRATYSREFDASAAGAAAASDRTKDILSSVCIADTARDRRTTQQECGHGDRAREGHDHCGLELSGGLRESGGQFSGAAPFYSPPLLSSRWAISALRRISIRVRDRGRRAACAARRSDRATDWRDVPRESSP